MSVGCATSWRSSRAARSRRRPRDWASPSPRSRRASAHSDARAGTLETAAPARLAVDPLAELAGALRSAHPALTVRITVAESSASASRLVAEGTAELGLVHLPVPREELVVDTLGSQELLFVLPPGEDTS